jgi:hypothetical protein
LPFLEYTPSGISSGKMVSYFTKKYISMWETWEVVSANFCPIRGDMPYGEIPGLATA